MDTNPITRLLDAVAAGTGVPTDIFAPDAVLDATVPGWRFEKHGPAAIATKLSGWYETPATLTEVTRSPVPGGETVRFTQACDGPAGPWAARQVHVLTVDGGRIVRQEMWCGGRWDAERQAAMRADLELARAAAR